MKRPQGVTIVELLIAVLILGVLSAVAIPRLAASAATAKRRACSANVERINSQIELYQHDTGSWPVALIDVTENVSYFGDEKVACPFGEPYILDQSIHRVIMHDHGGGFAPLVGGAGNGDDGDKGKGKGKGKGQGDNGNQGEEKPYQGGDGDEKGQGDDDQDDG